MKNKTRLKLLAGILGSVAIVQLFGSLLAQVFTYFLMYLPVFFGSFLVLSVIMMKYSDLYENSVLFKTLVLVPTVGFWLPMYLFTALGGKDALQGFVEDRTGMDVEFYMNDLLNQKEISES